MNNNQIPTKPPVNGQGQPQRPPVQGQRPIQGQPQRPPVQGQRPLQGQPQRSPMQGQRPPQGQPQRPPMQGQRPQQPAKKGNKAIVIAIVAVLILAIVGGLVAMTIALVNNTGGNASGGSSSGGSSSGGNKKPKPSEDSGETDDKSFVSAGIVLPSSTARGSYLSTNTPSTQISGISSAAAILVDVETNTAIAGKMQDERIYPASMTKVMTLLVACERATDAGKLLTVEQWMVDYQTQMEASGAGLEVGEQISVENALYLINYQSDTIACLLIAKHVAGSEEAFVGLMNEKAAELGLTNTHFTNTTGLHNEGHYTTCREMAAIMNCAMQNPIAKKIITSYEIRTIQTYKNYEKYMSRNPICTWYSDPSRFKDNPRYVGGSDITVIGGKTGYEDIPTGCFVTVGKDMTSNKQYICVTVGRINTSDPVVGASTSTADTVTVYKNYAK